MTRIHEAELLQINGGRTNNCANNGEPVSQVETLIYYTRVGGVWMPTGLHVYCYSS